MEKFKLKGSYRANIFVSLISVALFTLFSKHTDIVESLKLCLILLLMAFFFNALYLEFYYSLIVTENEIIFTHLIVSNKVIAVDNVAKVKVIHASPSRVGYVPRFVLIEHNGKKILTKSIYHPERNKVTDLINCLASIGITVEEVNPHLL